MPNRLASLLPRRSTLLSGLINHRKSFRQFGPVTQLYRSRKSGRKTPFRRDPTNHGNPHALLKSPLKSLLQHASPSGCNFASKKRPLAPLLGHVVQLWHRFRGNLRRLQGFRPRPLNSLLRTSLGPSIHHKLSCGASGYVLSLGTLKPAQSANPKAKSNNCAAPSGLIFSSLAFRRQSSLRPFLGEAEVISCPVAY